MLSLTTATLAILLVFRYLVLPGPLTSLYNNLGIQARAEGNLNQARHHFLRAAALNPDRVVPYFNLAEAYRDRGLDTSAVIWYEKAIEGDAHFIPAYNGLGMLYNQQAAYIQAEAVLLAGLSTNQDEHNDVLGVVTEYQLLSSLGWCYWEQGKVDQAKQVLLEALRLESELVILNAKTGVEHRSALPHFYLALVYEKSGETTQAQQHWEDSLRFLNPKDWRQKDRYWIAKGHLHTLIDQ